MLRVGRTPHALLILALEPLNSLGNISLVPVDLTAKFLGQLLTLAFLVDDIFEVVAGAFGDSLD